MFKAIVNVTLKKGVLDPQGTAVVKSLHSMGYQDVNDVRIGKYMEVILKTTDRERATKTMKDICSKLLANPVIEDYTFTLEEVES